MRAGATDAELVELITGVWGRREDRYSEEREDLLQVGEAKKARDRIEMYQVGG